VTEKDLYYGLEREARRLMYDRPMLELFRLATRNVIVSTYLDGWRDGRFPSLELALAALVVELTRQAEELVRVRCSAEDRRRAVYVSPADLRRLPVGTTLIASVDGTWVCRDADGNTVPLHEVLDRARAGGPHKTPDLPRTAGEALARNRERIREQAGRILDQAERTHQILDQVLGAAPVPAEDLVPDQQTAPPPAAGPVLMPEIP
jgi:hypothetical protein